ncbi:hypothetical protein F503_00946 [Ophiostoma piceae UAMH 11346]|uniref:Uncharacterized protein n=1 Tax=Ophiostoma piceae (strain UAMH 11346) TaxID=1262450 RepID=S3CNP7_OPHP1|nr:hypothetical protein F503_00946 [Ophiostoma piceae UAMH 11346]
MGGPRRLDGLEGLTSLTFLLRMVAPADAPIHVTVAEQTTPKHDAGSDKPVATPAEMFAAVMRPSALPMGPASPDRLPAMPSFASSPFRPCRPSPLSSSPTRAPSSAAAASSQMDTQSSPVQSSQQQQQQSIFNFATDAFNGTSSSNGNGKSLFRFASRPTKPVARGQQARDAAQQTRRSLFLRNVRQRADDRGWERRNFEQELQRMEDLSSEEEFRRAREAEAAELFASQDLDEDIEDSIRWAGQDPYHTHDSPQNNGKMYYDHDDDNDGMMDSDEHIADLLAMEEEAEIERLLALEQDQASPSLPEQPSVFASTHQLSRQPSSVFHSDDGEYDDIFAELASASGTEDTEMSCL